MAGDRAELLLTEANGGPEYRLGEIHNRQIGLMRLDSISWSMNGEWIGVSHRESSDAVESIYAFSLTGDKRQLTTAPKAYAGDYMPAFSPDGNFLAFCRLPGFSTSEIYLLPLESGIRPAGIPRSVTAGQRWAVSPVWIRSGRSMLHLFSEHPETRHELRRIDISDSPTSARTLPIPDEPAEIAAGPNLLLYSRRISDTNIWRAQIPGPGQPPAAPERFIYSTRRDGGPSYSPDGSRIAFVSNRSGSDEIWVAGADGTNAVRMTYFGGPLVGLMNWSPDGQRIVFHARPEGQADVFAIPAAGGLPERLTNHRADDFMPSFSHDGRWIYFASRRSGDYAIWKMPSSGDAPATQLTSSGGTRPFESADGRTVYYHTWPNPDGILAVPVDGGQPVKIIGPTHPFPIGFAVTRDGIYYPAPPHAGPDRHIVFFRFATGQEHPAVIVDRPFRLGMTVSPDGRFIAFDQLDDAGSDLMMMKGIDLQ